MAMIMVTNDKKDNEDERKYKKSRGTTGALQPRMLLAYVLVFLILCWKSQLDGRRSHDDGETGAALSGTICWEIIVLIFHPLLPHSPPLLSWHTRLHCLCWAAVIKNTIPKKILFCCYGLFFQFVCMGLHEKCSNHLALDSQGREELQHHVHHHHYHVCH